MAHAQGLVCYNLQVAMRKASIEGDLPLAMEKAVEIISQADVGDSSLYRPMTIMCRGAAFRCLGHLLPDEGGVIHFAEAVRLFDVELRACGMHWMTSLDLDRAVAGLRMLMREKETAVAEKRQREEDEAQRAKEKKQRAQEEAKQRAKEDDQRAKEEEQPAKEGEQCKRQEEQRVMAATHAQVHGRTTKDEGTQTEE